MSGDKGQLQDLQNKINSNDETNKRLESFKENSEIAKDKRVEGFGNAKPKVLDSPNKCIEIKKAQLAVHQDLNRQVPDVDSLDFSSERSRKNQRSKSVPELPFQQLDDNSAFANCLIASRGHPNASRVLTSKTVAKDYSLKSTLKQHAVKKHKMICISLPYDDGSLQLVQRRTSRVGTLFKNTQTGCREVYDKIQREESAQMLKSRKQPPPVMPKPKIMPEPKLFDFKSLSDRVRNEEHQAKPQSDHHFDCPSLCQWNYHAMHGHEEEKLAVSRHVTPDKARWTYNHENTKLQKPISDRVRNEEHQAKPQRDHHFDCPSLCQWNYHAAHGHEEEKLAVSRHGTPDKARWTCNHDNTELQKPVSDRVRNEEHQAKPQSDHHFECLSLCQWNYHAAHGHEEEKLAVSRHGTPDKPRWTCNHDNTELQKPVSDRVRNEEHQAKPQSDHHFECLSLCQWNYHAAHGHEEEKLAVSRHGTPDKPRWTCNHDNTELQKPVSDRVRNEEHQAKRQSDHHFDCLSLCQWNYHAAHGHEEEKLAVSRHGTPDKARWTCNHENTELQKPISSETDFQECALSPYNDGKQIEICNDGTEYTSSEPEALDGSHIRSVAEVEYPRRLNKSEDINVSKSTNPNKENSNLTTEGADTNLKKEDGDINYKNISEVDEVEEVYKPVGVKEMAKRLEKFFQTKPFPCRPSVDSAEVKDQNTTSPTVQEVKTKKYTQECFKPLPFLDEMIKRISGRMTKTSNEATKSVVKADEPFPVGHSRDSPQKVGYFNSFYQRTVSDAPFSEGQKLTTAEQSSNKQLTDIRSEATVSSPGPMMAATTHAQQHSSEESSMKQARFSLIAELKMKISERNQRNNVTANFSRNNLNFYPKKIHGCTKLHKHYKDQTYESQTMRQNIRAEHCARKTPEYRVEKVPLPILSDISQFLQKETVSPTSYTEMSHFKVKAGEYNGKYQQMSVDSHERHRCISEVACESPFFFLTKKNQNPRTEVNIPNCQRLNRPNLFKVSVEKYRPFPQLPKALATLRQKFKMTTSNTCIDPRIFIQHLLSYSSSNLMTRTISNSVFRVDVNLPGTYLLVAKSIPSLLQSASFLLLSPKLLEWIPIQDSKSENTEKLLGPSTDFEDSIPSINRSFLDLIVSNNALGGEDSHGYAHDNVQIVHIKESEQPQAAVVDTSLKRENLRSSSVQTLTPALVTDINNIKDGMGLLVDKMHERISNDKDPVPKDNEQIKRTQCTEPTHNVQLSIRNLTFPRFLTSIACPGNTENKRFVFSTDNFTSGPIPRESYKESITLLCDCKQKQDCVSDFINTHRIPFHEHENPRSPIVSGDEKLSSDAKEIAVTDTDSIHNDNACISNSDEESFTSCLPVSDNLALDTLVVKTNSIRPTESRNDTFYSLPSNSSKLSTNSDSSNIPNAMLDASSTFRLSLTEENETGASKNGPKTNRKSNLIKTIQKKHSHFIAACRGTQQIHTDQSTDVDCGHNPQILVGAHVLESNSQGKEVGENIITNKISSEVCCTSDILSNLENSTGTVTNETNKTACSVFSKISPKQTQTPFNNTKRQKRINLEHNVHKWLSSIAPSEILPLSDQLMNDSAVQKIQSQESISLVTNLCKTGPKRPASALTLLGERTASDKEKNNSYVVDIRRAITSRGPILKSHVQGNREVFIASESSSKDEDTKVLIKHAQPAPTLSTTKQANDNGHLTDSNAANSQGIHRVYSPLSDYKSCISFDTVSAFYENMPSSGSESFCTARSSEDMCIDTFLPLSKLKQKERQRKSIHKRVSGIKNIRRPKKVKIKDHRILKRTFPPDLFKHHKVESHDFMNKLRVSPENCECKLNISSSSNKLSNSSTIWHECVVQNCKPGTPKRVAYYTGQLSHILSLENPSNSDQAKHSSEIGKRHKPLVEFVFAAGSTKRGAATEASPVHCGKKPNLHTEGRNTTGGNQEGMEPEQGSEKKNTDKETPFTVGPATLSIVTVSQNGLLTTEVSLPSHTTMNKEIQCCPALRQDESVRLEMPPYQSTVATKSSICPEHPLTSTGYLLSRSGEEESGTIPPFCVPISDPMRDVMYFYRMSSNTPRTKTDMHSYLATNKCEDEHKTDKNRDIMNIATSQSHSLVFPVGVITTNPMCVLLDTKSSLLETTNDFRSTYSKEIRPSPSDEEVALIMCKTHSPVRTLSSGHRPPGREVLFLDDVSQKTVPTKGPPTPYPLLPTVSVKEVFDDEKLLVKSDADQTSVLYQVSHEEFSEPQHCESKYVADTEILTNRMQDLDCKQKNSRSDLPVYLSPEASYRALEDILADELMPGTVIENRTDDRLLSKLEMLLSPIYKEYVCSPCSPEMDDFSCYARKHLKNCVSSSGQNPTPQMYTKPAESIPKKNDNRIKDIIYHEDEDDDTNCNNDDKLYDLIHLLKDILMCLKNIEGKYELQEETLKERKDGVNLKSKHNRSEGTTKLSQTESTYPFMDKDLNQTDCRVISPKPGMYIKHVACTYGKNLKTLLAKALQTIHKLKLQTSNKTTRSISTVSSICKKHSEADALHEMFLPKQIEHENTCKFNIKENYTMSVSGLDSDSDKKKSFNPKNVFENKIHVQPDLSKKFALDIVKTKTTQMNSSKGKPPSTKKIFSHIGKEITENETTDKNEILGKIEIMCRYLQIPSSYLQRFGSNQLMTTNFSNSNTSSASVCGYRSCNDSEENYLHYVSSASGDTVDSDSENGSSNYAVFSPSENKKSVFEDTESLPFAYSKAVEAIVTSTNNTNQPGPHTDMALTSSRFPARSQFGELRMESFSINWSKRNSFQSNVESYETRHHSLPSGISSYTILQHPDWKDFNSIHTAFLEKSNLRNDSQKSKNDISSDTLMKEEINRVFKKKTTAIIRGHDKQMLCKHGEDKPYSLLGIRTIGLTHSFPGIATSASKKHHLAVAGSEPIVYTLDPVTKSYTLPSTRSSTKENGILHHKHGTQTNQKAPHIVSTATSEIKAIEAGSMNGIRSVNTSETHQSFPNTLGRVHSQLSAGFQNGREYTSKNSKGAKGYTVHKKGGKYVWNSHPLEQNNVLFTNNRSKIISHSGIDMTCGKCNWFASSEKKNEHKRFTSCKNNGNSNAVPHCLNTLNYFNACLDPKDENIKLRNMFRNLKTTKGRRNKECSWKPKRDSISPLDEPNAVFVSMCVVSETVDPITGQSLLSVTSTETKRSDKSQPLSRCTTMCNRNRLCDYNHIESVSPNIASAAFKPFTKSDIIHKQQNSVGLSGSFQSITGDSETEGTHEDGVLNSRQSHLSNTGETNEYPTYFSHMSTNQNAADSPPTNSDNCDEGDNQPVFSNFTFGSNEGSNLTLQTPPPSRGKLRCTLQCRQSTSEPSVPVSAHSVSTTVSACSSNEKLSMSDKINFFSRKIARLAKRKKSKAPSTVVTHKATPVRVMVEKYKIATRISNGLGSPKQVSYQFNDAHTSSNKHFGGDFSGCVKDTEVYDITSDKSEKDKTISCHFKLPDYHQVEESQCSDDTKLATNNFFRKSSKTETISESVEKDSLQSRRDTNVSRPSCYSARSSCKIRGLAQETRQNARLPWLMSKTSISYTDYQACKAKAKEIARRSRRETSNINVMNSAESLRAPLHNTNAISGRKSNGKPNYNGNSSDKDTGKLCLKSPLKDEITDYDIKSKCSSQETGMEIFRGSGTKMKPNKLFHPSADQTLSNLPRQKSIKHDTYKTDSIISQRVTTSETSHKNTSKRLIPCVNTTQSHTKKPVYQGEVSKNISLKRTKLPVKIRDHFTNTWRQHLDESVHLTTTLTEDSSDSNSSPERQSVGCGKKMSELMQADSDKTRPCSVESQGELETVSSGSFEIIGNSSGQSMSETSGSYEGERSSNISDFKPMNDQAPTPESVQGDDKSTSSNDSYATATQEVHRTTTQEYVYNENTRQGIYDAGRNHIYFFGDEPQYERFHRSEQTSRTVRTIPVPVAMGFVDMYDSSLVSVCSQESMKNIMCERSSNSCFKQPTRRSHVYDEGKHCLGGNHRTPSNYMSTYRQFSKHCPCQCLKHDHCILSNTDISQSDNRVCRICNCSRNVRYQHLRERRKQSAATACKCTTKETPASKISNEVNLSKSMIALSKSPMLNLPKYIGKLARFFKEPISSLNIFTRDNIRSMRPSPPYGDMKKSRSKLFMSQTGDFCVMESNNHLCEATKNFRKQKNLSGDPNAMKQKYIQERSVDLVKFWSPVADHTENTNACPMSVFGVSTFSMKQNSKGKLHEINESSIRFEEQQKIVTPQIVTKFRDSKQMSKKPHRRKTSTEFQKSEAKCCQKTSAQENRKRTPNSTSKKFPAEVRSDDTAYSNNDKHTQKRKRRSRAAEANLSKNANDDAVCQQTTHFDEEYETSSEGVVEPSHWSTHRSEKMPLNVNKNKSDNEMKNDSNQDSKPNKKDKTSDDVSTEKLSSRTTPVQAKSIIEHTHDNPTEESSVRSPKCGVYSTDVFVNPSSSTDSYVSIETEKVNLSNKIYGSSQLTLCKERKEEVKNSTSECYVRSSQSIPKNCKMLPSSKNHTWFNSHSFHPKKSETDLNKCSSQESAKESALLSSSEDGFISYVKVKRGCLNIHDAFGYYDPTELLDFEAHLKDSEQHVYNDEITFNEKTDSGGNLTNVTSSEIPMKDAHGKTDRATDEKARGTPESDNTKHSYQKQDKNVNKVITTESQELSDGNTVILSVQVDNSMSKEQIEVLALKLDDGQDTSQIEISEPPKSNDENGLCQSEKEIDDHEQKNTDEKKTEIGSKPTEHLTEDDTKKMKEESSNNIKQESGEKHENKRTRTERPNVDSEQPICSCEHCECYDPHSPIAKLEILKPSSEVQIVTTVRRTTRVCQGECVYSPKKEDRDMGCVNFQTPQRQLPSLHGKMPMEANHQDVFAQKEVKGLYNRFCDQCIAATKNTFNAHSLEGFDSSAHFKKPLVCIRTRSVKLNPRGLVTQHQIPKVRETRAKNPFHYYDPHTLPGKVQKSKKHCNLMSNPPGKYKFTDDTLKSMNMAESTGKTHRKKGKLFKESANMQSSKHNTAQWLSRSIGGKCTNKADKEEIFLSIPMFTQAAKFCTPDCCNKQSATDHSESVNDRKHSNHKYSESVNDRKHSNHKYRHSNKSGVFRAGKFVSFTGNHKKRPKHRLPNSKIMSVSSKGNTRSSLHSFDALSSSISSGEEISSEKSAMCKINPNKHSSIFPPKISSFCQISYGPTRFESCISLGSSELHSDMHAIFPEQEHTMSQSRLVQKMPNKRGCKYCATPSNTTSWSDRVKSSVDDVPNLTLQSKHMKEHSTNTSGNAHIPPKVVFSDAHPSNLSRSHVRHSDAHTKPFQSNFKQYVPSLKGSSQNNNGGSSKDWNSCPYHYTGNSKSNAVQNYPVKRLKSVPIRAVDQSIRNIQNTNRKNKSSRYDSGCSQYRKRSEYHEMNKTRIKNKDKNSNKKTTSFRITAEPSKDKKTPPAFKIEVSPLSVDSSAEPVTRHVKMEEMQSPNQAAKFIMTEIKRHKQTLTNATRHSFPPCAYKSSQTTAHGGSTTSKTMKLSSDSCCLASSSSDSTPCSPSAEKKITIQTKSPPKQPSVSSPRVYEVTATIQDREPTPPVLVKETVIHAVSHCSACDLLGPGCGTVQHTVSAVSILPSYAKTKLTSPPGPHPKCFKHGHTCQPFTRETISSDSAMDQMAEALTNLKQNPPTVEHKICPRSGIQNFRLARKSGCSVVSAVPSYCSVEDDHQLRTTHNFSLKRNTNIKRLSSDKTDSKRRLRQATRALRTQEILLRLVKQTHTILKNAMVTTRREIVEEKTRTRHRQLQLAMKVASCSRPVRKSQVQSTSSLSNEPHCVGDFSFGSFSDTDFSTHGSVSVTVLPGDRSSLDLISVQTTSCGDEHVRQKPGCTQSCFSHSETYSDPSVEMPRPVVDKLCSRCLLMGLNRRSIKPKMSWKRNTCPSCSTQLFKLNCGNHNDPRISLSTPSLTIECPTQRLYFQRWPQISKSDSSVSYRSFTDSSTESQQSIEIKKTVSSTERQQSTDIKKTVFQRKLEIPISQRRANFPCQLDGKRRPCTLRCLYTRECNHNESKKSTLSKKPTATHTTSLVRVHEDYFTHLQQLAKQVASQAVRDVSKYRLKIKKPYYSERLCESQSEIRYLLTLKDISHIVAAVCMTASNQGVTTDWKKFCSVLLQPGRQISLTTMHACGHSLDITPGACFHTVNPPAKPSQGFVASKLNRGKRVTLSEGSVRKPKMGKSELSNYASCYSSSRSPSTAALTNTRDAVPEDRHLSKSIISLSLKDSSSRDGHIPHNCCTSNRASTSYKFKPANATQSTAKTPHMKREHRKDHQSAWRHLRRSQPDTMCLVEHYQESIEELSSSLSSGSIQTRTERRASKIFISTLSEESQRCLQHRRSKPYNRHRNHQRWMRAPKHENKPPDYKQTSTVTTDGFYSPGDYSEKDGHMRRTDFKDSNGLDVHCCASETRGFLSGQQGHGQRRRCACTSPKHTCTTFRTGRAVSGHVTKCADNDIDISIKPSQHRCACAPKDCIRGQSHIQIDITNGYKIAPRLKSTHYVCKKSDNFVRQKVDRNSSQPACRAQRHQNDNQPAQHKSATNNKSGPKYHTEDLVEQSSLRPKRTPHDHLPSSFHETKSSTYKRSNDNPVLSHCDPAGPFYENCTGSSSRIQKSLFPHDAKIGYSSLAAHEHHRHHPERRHHIADDQWYQNRTRHHHHFSKNASCNSPKASLNAYLPANLTAERGRAPEREVRRLVERNLRTLARSRPQEAGRLSYQQLLWANYKVLDDLQRSSVWDADSLNRAFRDVVYRGYLQLHQPDVSCPH